jgi:hypothetical protein
MSRWLLFLGLRLMYRLEIAHDLAAGSRGQCDVGLVVDTVGEELDAAISHRKQSPTWMPTPVSLDNRKG